MAETPNHGYNRPDAGAENWDQPLNANFTEIDADIEIRDAGHPSNDNNYDPTSGAKYLDTASGVVYGADGTSWTATFVLPGYDQSADEAQLNQLALATLTGTLTGGTGLTDLTGTGLEISTESLGLTNDTVTVAGNSVSLGGSTGISHADLGGVSVDQHHAKNHDHSEVDISAIPVAGLEQSALTVAGNTVSLGGSTAISHGDLSTSPSDAHHTRPSAGNALADSNNTFDVEVASINHNNLTNGGQADAHHSRPSAGTGLSDNSNTFDVGAGAYLGTTGTGSIEFTAAAEWSGGGNNNIGTGAATTIAGGSDNFADAGRATVSGGSTNTASGAASTVGGGQSNEAAAEYATVSGGGPMDPLSDPPQEINAVYDKYGTVGGGGNNRAGVDGGSTSTARWATVSGGRDNVAGASGATVGGGQNNKAQAEYATISGGAPSDTFAPDSTNNVVYDNYGTIGGGGGNQAGTQGSDTEDAPYATVAGGKNNTASALGATVGGGGAVSSGNTASGESATVAGGTNNEATADRATVGGGNLNVASGNNATVPGGNNNSAEGRGSFAAGSSARAVDDDAFVWNDGWVYHDTTGDGSNDGLSSGQAIASNGNDPTGSSTFTVGAQGGVRFVTGSDQVTYLDDASAGWTSTSTRAAKTNVDPVDPEAALEGVEEMEVATWEYTDEDGSGAGTTHIGPMAEGFHDAFDVGSSDEHINSINADGAAFAAIQGLSEKLDGARAELDEREDRIDDLEAETDRLQTENDRLRERNADLEDRLSAIEAHMGLDESDVADGPAAAD